jgi:hypothetical protein
LDILAFPKRIKVREYAGFIGRTGQHGEKGRDFGEIGRKHTSVPKGRLDLTAFMPGMNPRPTSRESFSASC